MTPPEGNKTAIGVIMVGGIKDRLHRPIVVGQTCY